LGWLRRETAETTRPGDRQLQSEKRCGRREDGVSGGCGTEVIAGVGGGLGESSGISGIGDSVLGRRGGGRAPTAGRRSRAEAWREARRRASEREEGRKEGRKGERKSS